jgi:hypothetical protein
MLRVAVGVGRHRLTGYYTRHQFSGAPATLSRSFFSFGSKEDGSKDNSNGNAGSSDDNSNKSDQNNSSSSGSSSASSSALLPSKLKYGDEAPRFPHTLALPLVNRPLFPGVFTSVTVSDPVSFLSLLST